MAEELLPEVYQIHAWIRQITPMIWRRLWVRSDSTIADLHYILQITFGWDDCHLHRFHIHGRDYGIYQDGGITFSSDPDQVKLCDFRFRINERFVYEYDFGDGWQHEIRIEKHLPLKEKQLYPFCIDGRRQCPPEDCGGAIAFMARKDELPSQIDDIYWQLLDDIEAGDHEALQDRREEIESIREWFTLDEFNKKAVNQKLQQYVLDGTL